MKKIITSILIISVSRLALSWEFPSGDHLNTFIKSQGMVQALIEQQGGDLACGNFGEFALLSKENLETRANLIKESIRDQSIDKKYKVRQKNELKQIEKELAIWPQNVDTIIVGQSECTEGIGQKGVSAVVAINNEGVLTLLSAQKY